MSDEEILQKLTGIFRDVFEDPALTINPGTTAQDIAEWDSVMHINIIVASEIAFGVKFKTAEIEELQNVGEFVRLIQKQLAAKK